MQHIQAKLFRSAKTESKQVPKKPRYPALKLAFLDEEFLLRRSLRSVRLQLELLKPEILQQDEHIASTVVIFGSARIAEPKKAKAHLAAAKKQLKTNPKSGTLIRAVKIAEKQVANSFYYDAARKLGILISQYQQTSQQKREFVVVTGGGPGIMEAANRGAHDVKAKSIGLNIVLPFEQEPNPYISPELCFQFHYFAVRKMHFLIRARALICFPGGYGTLDELFETLTLMQTKKIKLMPLLLFGKEYWSRLINFDVLVEEGMISKKDISLFQFVETAEEAWKCITDFYHITA
jgi:uncharacterized protein (TIGR00730 family)